MQILIFFLTLLKFHIYFDKINRSINFIIIRKNFLIIFLIIFLH